MIRAFYERRAVRLIPELVVCLGVQVALALVGALSLSNHPRRGVRRVLLRVPARGRFHSQCRPDAHDPLLVAHARGVVLRIVGADGRRAHGQDQAESAVPVDAPRSAARWRCWYCTASRGAASDRSPSSASDPRRWCWDHAPRCFDDLLAARGPRRTPPLGSTVVHGDARLPGDPRRSVVDRPARWFLWPVGMVLTCISVVSLSCGREIRPIEWLYTRRLVGKVGSACYAIYIWHMVPFVLINGESAYEAKRHTHPWWITLPVSTLITVAIGLASTEFIAIPARKLYVARKHR